MRGFTFLSLACCMTSLHADVVWPTPKSMQFSQQCVTLAPSSTFTFNVIGATNDILQSAISRYGPLFFTTVPSAVPSNCSVLTGTIMPSLNINVTSASTYLGINVSEAYTIIIPASNNTPSLIHADTVFGALRALETFSQLIDFQAPSTSLIPIGTIQDEPAFSHRSGMLDTARHFIPLPSIFAFIDAMAYNKFNVFHWHLVDDQSFPYVSSAFPNLSALGAYGAPDLNLVASHTYLPSEVQEVISYARLRGIRVLAEFDTPGHSLSWGKSVPNLLTQCYNTTTNQPIPGSFGPIDPTLEANFDFLQSFFTEVTTVFPDDFIHIGGDEVSYTCWASNPNINAWMAANGINAGNYTALEGYYVQRIINMFATFNKKYIGWEEIFDNNLDLSPDCIVNVWKYHNTGAAVESPPTKTSNPHDGNGLVGNITWEGELYNVTKAGYQAIVSSFAYLNYIAYGMDWAPYLTTDLLAFGGSAAQNALVLGGEFCMWSEYVDATNVLSRTFPRASAVAEALWARPGSSANISAAEIALSAMQCRMISRGIAAEPADGPSFCHQEYVTAYVPPWMKA